MSNRAHSLTLMAVLTVNACTAGAPTPPQTAAAVSPIVNGTRDPQAVPLTPGQVLALGWLFQVGDPSQEFCTGTLIGPHTVATAAHCMQGEQPGNLGFGVGQMPGNPTATFDVAHIYVHPQLDIAILDLAEVATDRVPELTPIPANAVDPSPLQATSVQVGGYGETYDRARTGQYFASVQLSQVTAEEVIIDGQGRQGVCFGDSGGPTIGDLGTGPVVLGVESWGDQSCVDVDHMTRLDIAQDFLAPILAGEAPPDNCMGLDYLGHCTGSTAEWCENGQIRSEDCGAQGMACGYVDDQTGWYCMDGPAPANDCNDVGATPVCVGANQVVHCANGSLVTVTCVAGQSCVDDPTGAYCDGGSTGTDGGAGPDPDGGVAPDGSSVSEPDAAQVTPADAAAPGTDTGTGAGGSTSNPDPDPTGGLDAALGATDTPDGSAAEKSAGSSSGCTVASPGATSGPVGLALVVPFVFGFGWRLRRGWLSRLRAGALRTQARRLRRARRSDAPTRSRSDA